MLYGYTLLDEFKHTYCKKITPSTHLKMFALKKTTISFRNLQQNVTQR